VVYPVEVERVEAGKTERSLVPKEFFTEAEQKRIVQCVVEAESKTAAEFRVRLERRCDQDPVKHCHDLLRELGIVETEGRSGLLIYLSTEDRKVAIYGDEAIHKIIGDDGWTRTCEQLRSRFGEGDFATAICDAIHSMAETLAVHFPVKAVNPNELPDEPSIEE
jgi:uncharacterized membrane protein